MKLFVEKIVIGDGLSRIKAHVVNNTLTSAATNYEDVEVLSSRSLDTAEYDTNNTLYDVDSVNMEYFSDVNEDNSFKLPPIRHKDIMQYNDYGFALSSEVSGQLSVPLDKFKFTDRYSDMNNNLISYDGSRFGDVTITPDMSETQVFNELMNVFGSANANGDDSEFVNKTFSELHPSINISSESGSLPFSYILETDLTRMQNVDEYGTLEINLFKTKNHLKNDYNIYVDDSDRVLAWRRYKSIGLNYENVWLSYSVDFADTSTNEHLTSGYETIEHIDGFVKYKPSDSLHKSNIYSIRIHNSGLSAEGDIYEEMRKIFEKSIFNLMTKIAPMHCQLWKIEYIDE